MTTDQFIEGIAWCVLVGGGLFCIFILVSLFMLFFAKPDRNGNLTRR